MAQLLTKRLPVNIHAELLAPLASLEANIRETVKIGQQVDVLVLLSDLQKDLHWAAALDAQERLSAESRGALEGKGHKSPEQFGLLDINFMSYIVAYMKQLDGGKGVVVALENPEEGRILDQVQHVMTPELYGGHAKGVILGLYVHPRLAVTEEGSVEGKRWMYYVRHDGLSQLKTITGAYPSVRNQGAP